MSIRNSLVCATPNSPFFCGLDTCNLTQLAAYDFWYTVADFAYNLPHVR
jgi:hypothetical protein